MTREEAQHLALGYAMGRNAAEEAHGSGCCCKNCPWTGNHGWTPVRTAGSAALFMNAFAKAHADFNAGAGPLPPTVDRAWAQWQQTDGKSVFQLGRNGQPVTS